MKKKALQNLHLRCRKLKKYTSMGPIIAIDKVSMHLLNVTIDFGL